MNRQKVFVGVQSTIIPLDHQFKCDGSLYYFLFLTILKIYNVNSAQKKIHVKKKERHTHTQNKRQTERDKPTM